MREYSKYLQEILWRETGSYASYLIMVRWKENWMAARGWGLAQYQNFK